MSLFNFKAQIGQIYPLAFSNAHSGVVMQFLCEDRNLLILKMPNMSAAEFSVLKSADLSAGYKHCKTTNTLQWLVKIGKGKKELLFDGQFNPRLPSVSIPRKEDLSWKEPELEIHVTDEFNTLRLKRVIKFPITLFKSFLSDATQLLKKKNKSGSIRSSWELIPLTELVQHFQLQKFPKTKNVAFDPSYLTHLKSRPNTLLIQCASPEQMLHAQYELEKARYH